MPSDEDGVPADPTADDGVPEDDDESDEALSGELGELLSLLEEEAEQVENIVEGASSIIVEGTAAGGSVVVNITGNLEAVAVQIDPALVDASDIGLLEDAVLAALRDALSQVRALQQELAGTLEEAEIDLSTLLGNLGNIANLGGIALPDFGNLSNPEDLIAGLTGALGNFAGGSGLGGLGGLGSMGDLMAGLGVPSAAPAGTGEGETASPAGAGNTESETDTESEGDSEPDAGVESEAAVTRQTENDEPGSTF
jgi:DNA-binding YbaB/EbfC family protein